MGFKLDLSNVEVKDFSPVPAGRYLAKVDDLVHVEESKRSKQPKVQLTFTLLKGLDAETEGYNSDDHRKAFYEFSLQEQSLWNAKRTLIALGDDPADLDQEIDINKEDYIGRECVLVMGIEEYEGVPRQRTRRVEPLMQAPAPAAKKVKK